ncbi:tellurite resistance TerB family protein [Pseudothauera lacus]|uniref:DUF533 domain-containing protein n=1 Tax=Pseudothauera lacus TaxID=2136175 RepID=A0A2T4ID93_9RHOO|nr:tellurite resistance TerB family protein [Pseudothauera lacus]PTD95708.1 DUF533 domain-containing protein [Pseudothauera lacus]
MSFGNLIGQILQQGMSAKGGDRLQHSLGAQGLGDLLGSVLGGAGGSSPAGASGGLGGLLGAALGGGRGSGGAADLIGAMLGGARAPASGGQSGSGGMAVLAALAMAAFKNWTAQGGALAGFAGGEPEARAAIAELTAPDTERLVLRAMLCAAKADGVVDEEEIERIVGKISGDGVSAEERQYLVDELHRPLDLPGLIRDVPNAAVAAQVYGASLLAIDLDTAAERDYMRRLAAGLRLDADAVARLHQLTGAPLP